MKTSSKPISELSDEELRVKVAELCGWTRHRIEKSSDGIDIYESVWCPSDHKPPMTNDQIQEHVRISLPDYPRDLNAALTLCNLLADRGFTCRIDNGLDKTWECTFEKPIKFEQVEQYYAPADTLARAICEAFVNTLTSGGTGERSSSGIVETPEEPKPKWTAEWVADQVGHFSIMQQQYERIAELHNASPAAQQQEWSGEPPKGRPYVSCGIWAGDRLLCLTENKKQCADTIDAHNLSLPIRVPALSAQSDEIEKQIAKLRLEFPYNHDIDCKNRADDEKCWCGEIEYDNILNRILSAANKEKEGDINFQMTYFRYSHDEIEAACGGETALAVREKVMKRREAILGHSAVEAGKEAK